MTRNRSDSRMPADQDRRDRIVIDLDRNMLVEAAAGTGKTASMVERMIALIAGGKCEEIRTLAAVTFTRKAAAELRARFQVRLEKAVREADGRERELLEKALRNIEQVFIGTIHSFCGRLLRERPVEAGVDLAFEEIDEDVDKGLRTEAWEELSASLLSEETGGLHSQLDHLGLALDDLESTFIRFADFPDVDEWPVPDEDRGLPDLDPVRSELLAYVTHMRRLARDLPAQWGTDNLIPAFKRLPRVVSHYGDLRSPSELMDLLSHFDRKGKATQKEWMREERFSRDDARQEEARWNRFREEVVQPTLRTWYEFRYPTVLRVLFRARTLYDRLRAERGQLNFQDLLIKAADLLRDKPHVRRYFRDRFRFLLVDEFQDTDPVQAEVMMLLTATDLEETQWRKCVPRPGSLFVVGDPKQSIYRFRRADIVTYNEVKSMIRRGEGKGKEGILLTLSVNFRTAGPIIEWVNRVFEPEGADPDDSPSTRHRFPHEDSDESPGYVPLQAGRVEGNEGSLSGLYVLSIPEDCSDTDEAVAYEADRIARTIRFSIDSGMTVARTKRELEEGKSAEVDPDDFMIVTFKRKHLSVYARKLQDLGIPHQVSGGTTLNEVGELELLHLCLEAVVHPDNPVSLVAVLRSELFGLSDVELYAFKRAGGRFSYREAIPEGLGEAETQVFGDVFERLRRYARWLARMPVLAAIEKVVADLGLMALAGSRSGGDVEAGSLAKAIEILRDAQRQMWTSAQAVEQLGDLVRREAPPHDGISARSGERPLVRIMNLHKVKGLEAAVVFLAGPSGEYDHGVQTRIDRSGDRVLGHMVALGPKRANRMSLLAHPEGWEQLAEKEKAFVQAEALRLRYVAATRAGSALIVTRRLGKGKNRWNPWKGFEPFVVEETELIDPGPQSPPEERRRPLPSAEIEETRKKLASRLLAVMDHTLEVEAAKQYALATVQGETPQAADRTSLEEGASPGHEPSHDGEHGVEWGTVIHVLLQLAMDSPDADLHGLAMTALREHGLDASLAETAVETVDSVMNAGIWQRALASPKRLVEVPFEILLDHEASLPVLVRGSIDLVFKETGGWVLVDYKTDRFKGGTPKHLLDKYAPQVRFYAESWKRMTGEEVKEMGLYFLRADRFERLDF